MGPSGAGKSTLMNLLSGRLKISKSNSSMNLEGDVRLNNIPLSNVDINRISSYVKQEDHLIQTHKVREAIEFSTKLRCKGSPKEKKALADSIIVDLGLQKCENTMIGGVFTKGVSGGEKKRTSIAIDLVTNPKMLFLDEPTTGLDSYSAEKIVETLKKLNKRNRTIVMTIHQPNSKIYNMLERLLLVVDGGIV